MTTHEFHRAAERLARQRGISLEIARSELSRRGGLARKRRDYGRTTIDSRQAAETRKAMGRGYWWQDGD